MVCCASPHHGRTGVCLHRDTGHRQGIDEALQQKIFEPYFSTKESISNLGMGLYLVDKAVREHGGFIEIVSEKEKGTIFYLYLPAPSLRVSEAKPREAPRLGQNLSGRTILVVDDEYLVRELLKGILSETGARLLEAENGEDALEIYARHQHEIDLVILDVIMPGMKGTRCSGGSGRPMET
jgi:hypothetical protein